MFTGRKFIWLGLTCSVATLQLAQKSSDFSPLATYLNEIRTQQVRDRDRSLKSLQSSINPEQPSRDSALNALAVGNMAIEAGDFSSALTYLTTAQQQLSDVDPITPYLQLRLAIAYLKTGHFSEAISAATSIMNSDVPAESRKKILETKISALYELGDYKSCTSMYRQYDTRFKRQRSDYPAVMLKHVASCYKSLSQRQEEIAVLELLTMQYPFNEEAKWAFNQLVDYNTSVKNVRAYYFSIKILRHLAVNRTLQLGIEEFILDQLEQPVRDVGKNPTLLPLIDKVELLLKMGLPNNAKRYESDLVTMRSSGRDWQQEKASYLLSCIEFDLKNYQVAANMLREHVAVFPRHANTLRALSQLALAYNYLGEYQQAATIYERLYKYHRRADLSWDHFWNVYLAKDYEQALALLDRTGYVKAKDDNEPMAPTYWRGVILDKLNRSKEADAAYHDILTKAGQSYYANLVIARRPLLWTAYKTANSWDNLNLYRFYTDSLAASRQAKHNPFAFSVGSLIHDLFRIGIQEDAVSLIKQLRSKNKLEEVLDQRLLKLIDAATYRQLMLNGGSELRNAPRHLSHLRQHIERRSSIWSTVFPLVHPQFLNAAENHLNIDKLLLVSVMLNESRFNQFARSHVGARGLMQIMPKTALKIAQLNSDHNFQVTDLFSAEVSIGYGAFYLKRLLDYYRGNFFLAIGAYNAGPVAMDRWLNGCSNCDTDELVESIKYRETRRYVKDVTKYYGIYSKIYRQTQPFWEIPALPKEPQVDGEVF